MVLLFVFCAISSIACLYNLLRPWIVILTSSSLVPWQEAACQILLTSFLKFLISSRSIYISCRARLPIFQRSRLISCHFSLEGMVLILSHTCAIYFKSITFIHFDRHQKAQRDLVGVLLIKPKTRDNRSSGRCDEPRRDIVSDASWLSPLSEQGHIGVHATFIYGRPWSSISFYSAIRTFRLAWDFQCVLETYLSLYRIQAAS